MQNYPAIAGIEVSPIAKGIRLADYILKKAPVEIAFSRAVSPGKFVLVFAGDEASALESLNEAKFYSENTLIDSFIIPNVHPQILATLRTNPKVRTIQSIGIIEVSSVASTIESADLILKAANVSLLTMRLAEGIGGKGYYTFSGDLNDIEAARDTALHYFETKKDSLVALEVIASPHEDFKGVIEE